ncbi:probable Arginase [Saccharomycodes ludwigii]|uniref:Arginase n=1 Tax=Saccharomycodes ludwigii TaxID=36035 RepID=A0A376B6L9_9ASCO|nr:hypothetical protein SCDLUD_002074 [Saccharomycodes ludwigii]KAH3902257.1 hypothetical protein SCDLUD_002074 [Saccharomycodes ludwigii]SSD60281.1 probable Arginase [Saccharomycodes ludwigii]
MSLEAKPYYKHFPKKHNDKRSAGIITAPFSGGQAKSGVENGPKYLLKHGLQQQLDDLGWETSIEEPLKNTDFEERKLASTKASSNGKVKRADLVGEATKLVYESCKKVSNDENKFQITLGGDHSIAIGSIHAVLEKYPDAGILWIDAHADINTPSTTDSGNLHGCPVSFLLGLDRENCPEELKWVKPGILKPNKIAYIGLRDVDDGERKILRDLNISCFSMHHVDRFGINKVVEMALDKVTGGEKDCPVMVSYDVDGIDPLFVPATGTPVRGGLTLREGLFICERVAESGNLVALDVVECNPELASHDLHVVDTISAGCAIVRCTLGETLL